ncbi:MAG: NUMOD3 domain-containing DNA-binding protein [Verrucomicrobiia bacterium]
MIGTIYLIVNHSTGKIYVGQTVKPDLRKYLRRKVCDALNQTHAKTRNGSPYLYNAIRKYGAAAFKIYALVSGITGRDLLNRSEQFFIKAFRSRTPGIGYNMTVGGDGGGTGADNPFFGKTHSNATKARLRESRIGRPMLPETKALIAATHRAKGIRPPSWLGKQHTPEEKRKIGAGRMGKNHTEETKAYLRENHPRNWLGLKHREETKRKMSAAQYKRREREEASGVDRRRIFTPLHCQHIREALARKKNNPTRVP